MHFSTFDCCNGPLGDLREEPFHSRLSTWNGQALTLPGSGTHFGFVFEGSPLFASHAGSFQLQKGMYFSLPGAGTIGPEGCGFVATRMDYHGFFNIGGPVEPLGRLRYIDGCTDSLLISPVVLGDPCFNFLNFPAGTNQTSHTHPSHRIGMVINGRGYCRLENRSISLEKGLVFVIPAHTVHGFVTRDSSMSVIAYHPDSDFWTSTR